MARNKVMKFVDEKTLKRDKLKAKIELNMMLLSQPKTLPQMQKEVFYISQVNVVTRSAIGAFATVATTRPVLPTFSSPWLT